MKKYIIIGSFVAAILIYLIYIRPDFSKVVAEAVAEKNLTDIQKSDDAIQSYTDMKNTLDSSISEGDASVIPLELANKSHPRKYSEAKLLQKKDLSFPIRWLNDVEIRGVSLIDLRAKSKPVSSKFGKLKPISTKKEAVNHLNMNISMALRPSTAYEDAECYYFSGGTTAYAVHDFSKGILIRKQDGEISIWGKNH